MQTRGYWKWQNFSFRDEQLGPAEAMSLWQTCPLVLMLDPSVGSVFYEEFFEAPDETRAWTQVEDAGKTGTDAIQDAAGGVYLHYDDGDNEDESYMVTKGESWLVRAGKPIWFEAKVIPVEGNTDAANFIVGLMENPGANAMQDAGAGPPANSDHIVWFKRDGNMFWEFEVSNGATQVTKADLKAHVSGTGHKLGFFVATGKDSDTVVTVYPSFDGEILWAYGCALTIAGLGEMKALFGEKNGSAAGGLEDSISIDYMKIVQPR